MLQIEGASNNLARDCEYNRKNIQEWHILREKNKSKVWTKLT